MSTKKSIQVFTLLAASLLATACASQSETTQSSSTSSSQVTVKSSRKPSKSSTPTSAKATVGSSTTMTEQSRSSANQATSSSSSAISQENSNTATPQATATAAVSQLNPEAIARGDFSTLAGTWVNGKGESLVFDQSGFVSLGNNDPDLVLSTPLALNPNDGVLTGGFHHKKHGFGMALLVFPAGKMVKTFDQHGKEVETPVAPDDRDHIQIGQSLSLDAADRYYKQ